ncbi:hypothetical protein V5799_033737, partial [Amblyomma americanum]
MSSEPACQLSTTLAMRSRLKGLANKGRHDTRFVRSLTKKFTDVTPLSPQKACEQGPWVTTSLCRLKYCDDLLAGT